MRNVQRLYISVLFLMPLLLCLSCEDFLDLKPYDALTSEQLLLNESGIAGITNGSLRMMKDPLTSRDSYTYIKILVQSTEYPADNILITKPTTSTLWLSITRDHTPIQTNISYFWSTAYKIILNSNTIINKLVIDETTSDLAKQYLGENYFYRGIAYFDLARIFSFPPSHGADKMGLVLRTKIIDDDAKSRSSVAETYQQIISDLKKGAELMTMRPTEGIKYGNKYAALGFLSRAYLFTEQYDSVIIVADQLLKDHSLFNLESRETYVHGLQNSFDSKEALFIIYHADNEARGSAGIGSMYNGDGGWGEIFPCEPFRDLISKYPHDVRNDLMDTIFDAGGNPEFYQGTDYKKIYITKYSYQNNIATAHSPILMRLSEVLLNRAEAFAHLGMDDEALADVNIIRERAGLSGDELIRSDNLSIHGFTSVLAAVLNERRLEFAFEGYRRDDLLRNKIDLDRSYRTAQNLNGDPDIYPFDGPRQIFYIPLAEIAYNPLCIQNE